MRETITIGGLALTFLHSKDDTQGSLDCFAMTAQPKARMPVPHYHETWDETVFGLSGTITFTVDGKAVPLSSGDSCFIRRGIVHGFTNASQDPATCLCVLTPGVLGKNYFREIAELMAGGKPDLARMREIMLSYGLVPVVGGGDPLA